MTLTNDQSETVATFYARLKIEPSPDPDVHPFDTAAEKRSIDRHGIAAAQWLKSRATMTEIDAVSADLKALLTARQPTMGLEQLRAHSRRLAVAQAALNELRR